ncbi:MAG: alpha/beta hydrolase [Lachnospiraceae bacterium]|nr:alpha/beta hydrolase [Lachnospiraceae bacterium]
MMIKNVPIKCEGSMPYASLTLYIQENKPDLAVIRRPLVLLCPGGAYFFTSDRESEPLALTFLNTGCHAAILNYSVRPARYPVALKEVAASMIYIREHADEFNIDADKIILQGCSAGGHLAASYCCLWDRELLSDKKDISILKPNGLILCYPVITSGEYAHRGSFENLLGEENCNNTEMLDMLSLEKRAGAQVPNTFIWHTFEDESVPVENSLLFAQALSRAKVRTELHIFPEGGHGLSLANEITLGRSGKELQESCQKWPLLAAEWIHSFYPLTLELDKDL